jgi:hypothetical protein
LDANGFRAVGVAALGILQRLVQLLKQVVKVEDVVLEVLVADVCFTTISSYSLAQGRVVDLLH